MLKILIKDQELRRALEYNLDKSVFYEVFVICGLVFVSCIAPGTASLMHHYLKGGFQEDFIWWYSVCFMCIMIPIQFLLYYFLKTYKQLKVR